MTTIGYATLQIIASLRGVTEQIDQQIDGKVVSVTIEPKVDQKAADSAGKQTRETVEKHTKEVTVEPKVDKAKAQKAGKETGETVTKEVKDAVRKGDIGKTVGDEVTSSTKKSSAGKEAAKIIVDGIADGVKQEMRDGGVGEVIVDGITDGVKQGIDEIDTRSVGKVIRSGIESGNLGGAIKDAVLPGITGIGDAVRSSARDWTTSMADALRSGDIEAVGDQVTGTLSKVSNSVTTLTEGVADIGEAFGFQTDDIRAFGTGAGSVIGDVILKTQGIVDTLSLIPGAAKVAAAGFAPLLGPITAAAAALAFLTSNTDYGKLAEVRDSTPGGGAGLRNPLSGKSFNAPDAPRPPTPGGGGAGAQAERRGTIAVPPGFKIDEHGQIVKKALGGVVSGPGGIDNVFAMLTSGEGVLTVDAMRNGGALLMNALNAGWKPPTDLLKALLPGYAGGGLVAGTAELRKLISERFGISDIGGWRPQDKYGEHSTGRALDVMVGSNKAKGDAVKDFVLANAPAVDLKWVIWRQHLYYPGGGGYDMPDRGSPTQNHMDHVHIFSGTKILNGLLGNLQGKQQSVVVAATSGDDGATEGAASGGGNYTPADTSVVSSAVGGAAGSSGGTSLPTSISGLSSFGLNGLGSGVGKTDSGSDLSLFGKAAGSAVSGQVSSLLGVLGVPDSPGWLQGISTFVSGISVSDSSTGAKIFDGGSLFGGGFGGVAPLAAAPTAGSAADLGNVHGARAGQQPGPVFQTTIQARDSEDAVTQWRRWQDERTAAKLSRF